MMEVMSLEDWIHSLIEKPDLVLTQEYFDTEATFVEVDALRSPAEVSDETLTRLHQRIRNKTCEENIWSAVIEILVNPLPSSVAHDLIDRGVAINMLGHSRQVDSVQWRMASFYDEALITLAVDLYANPERNLSDLQTLFQVFPEKTWVLETLLRHNAGSPEKEQTLVALIKHHPQVDKLQEIYDTHRAEIRAGDPNISLNDIKDLFRAQKPRVLKALAANPQTPDDLLEQLVNIRDINLAREIRHRAKRNLVSRKRNTTIG